MKPVNAPGVAQRPPSSSRAFSPDHRALLSLVAVLTMAVDHAGQVFLPGHDLPRAVGRLSFPLVAALVADGALRTRDPCAYALRLLALAVVSQPIYQWALDPSWSNVLFEPMMTLRAAWVMPWLAKAPVLPVGNVHFLLALAVPMLQRVEQHRIASLPVFGLAAFLLPVEYGLGGLCTVLLLHGYLRGVLAPAVLVAGSAAVSAWQVQHSGSFVPAFALAYLLLVIPRAHWLGVRWRLPRASYYLFYPAHLSLLGVLGR